MKINFDDIDDFEEHGIDFYVGKTIPVKRDLITNRRKTKIGSFYNILFYSRYSHKWKKDTERFDNEVISKIVKVKDIKNNKTGKRLFGVSEYDDSYAFLIGDLSDYNITDCWTILTDDIINHIDRSL